MVKPPAKIKRWLLRLQTFKFNVKYIPEKSNIVDCLSRLCKLKDASFDEPNEYHVQIIIKETVAKALSISRIIVESKADLEIKDCK